jgi:LCP family protein required for cell wall assembly
MTLLPRTRGGALWRFALAAVLVVGLTAATTAVAGLLQVKSVLDKIGFTAPLKHVQVTLPAPGAPETLLLVGSDHRAGEPYRYSNTDTMMLVRIDDSSSTVNLLSIPRDLQVTLPGAGGFGQKFKLNAMYSLGGIPLLLRTLKAQVFPGLQVNHVLDVNFRAFSQMIDALGCVYTMVDHRYYNVSAPGPNNFSTINIQPGYQRLCGDNQAPSGALAFVRFRHTDSDIVRSARQQDFIRWLKDSYGVSQLLNQQDRLERIFGRNVQTDRFLHTTDGLIELFDLLVNADKLTLKSIPFKGSFLNSTAGDYVTSTPQQEAAAYRAFMTPTRAPASHSTPPAAAGPAASHRSSRGAGHVSGLTADAADGRAQARAVARVGFPVYYPKQILAAARYCFSITANCDSGIEPQSAYAHSYPRRYEIHAPHGGVYPAYVFTLEIDPVMGQYYSIQWTTWLHPPILRSPTKVQVVGGRKLYEYYNGGKLSLVAFRTSRAVYWVANSLTDTIGPRQMIAIAASFTRLS